MPNIGESSMKKWIRCSCKKVTSAYKTTSTKALQVITNDILVEKQMEIYDLIREIKQRLATKVGNKPET